MIRRISFLGHGGIIGVDWIFFGLGVFADMAGYFGGYHNRERLPYGDQIP